MKSISFVIVFFFAFSFTQNMQAQAEMSPDEMAIHKIINNMQTAWAEKDGEQFSTNFADDHDFVVWSGLYFPNIDKAINAQSHQGIFNSIYKNWDVDLRIDKIRFIRPDLALVHTLGGGREKGQPAPAYPSVLQSILMEKTDAGWQIISFHNMKLEWETMLRNNFPTEEEKIAYAKEHYRGWYQ